MTADEITEIFGPRCAEFDSGCSCCWVWRQYDEIERLRRIAWLIGSIFVHGDFKAETFNERELERLLRENGTFWDSLDDFDAALADQPSEVEK